MHRSHQTVVAEWMAARRVGDVERAEALYREMKRTWDKRYATSRRQRIKSQENEKIDRAEVFARDRWVCGICGGLIDSGALAPDPESPSVDHVVPLSKGGTHTMDNVQAAHLLCNSRKQEH